MVDGSLSFTIVLHLVDKEPSTTAVSRLTSREFIKDEARKMYSLSFEARPYLPGTFMGRISVGRTLQSYDCTFVVEDTNHVESIKLEIKRDVITLPSSPHDSILFHAEATFATKDKQSLPERCLANFRLPLTANGVTRTISLDSCRPNVRYEYGRTLTISASLNPVCTPGSYQLCVEYTENRPRLEVVTA